MRSSHAKNWEWIESPSKKVPVSASGVKQKRTQRQNSLSSDDTDARRKQHWNDHQRSDRNRWYDWNNNRDTGSRRWHDDRGGSSRGGDIEERNKLSVKQFAMDVDEEEDKPPAEVVQKQLQRRAARQLLRLILAESCMK